MRPSRLWNTYRQIRLERYLANVPITVEDLPDDQDLLADDPPLSPGILGLFRGSSYGAKAAVGDPCSPSFSSIPRQITSFCFPRDFYQ